MKGQWIVVLRPQSKDSTSVASVPVEIQTGCHQCRNGETVYKFYDVDDAIVPTVTIKKRFLWWTWEVTEEVDPMRCRFIVPAAEILYVKHVIEDEAK